MVSLTTILQVFYEMGKHRLLAFGNEWIDSVGWGEGIWHGVLWLWDLRIGPVIPTGLIILFIMYRNRLPHSLQGWWELVFKNRDLEGRRCFLYNAPGPDQGTTIIGKKDLAFTLHFTELGSASIRLYKTHSVLALVHIKGTREGAMIGFHGDSEKDLEITENEHAILKNPKGYFMQLRILSVRKTGSDKAEVCFAYKIDPEGRSEFKAL